MGRALPGMRARRRRRRAGRRPAPACRRSSCATSGRTRPTPTAPPGEPWRTGDRVTRDEDGFLYFEGRLDDLIISAGYRIGPFEVESALVAHRAVAEAAVVAHPDEERGAVVRAVIVLRDGHDPSEGLARELQDHVKADTAPYKYPRVVDFARELPKTASGQGPPGAAAGAAIARRGRRRSRPAPSATPPRRCASPPWRASSAAATRRIDPAARPDAARDARRRGRGGASAVGRRLSGRAGATPRATVPGG